MLLLLLLLQYRLFRPSPSAESCAVQVYPSHVSMHSAGQSINVQQYLFWRSVSMDYLQAEICHKICAALCCFEPGGRPFRRHPQSQMSRALGFIDCIRIYPGLCYFFAQRLKLGIRRNMCHTRQKSSCMTLIQHLQP